MDERVSLFQIDEAADSHARRAATAAPSRPTAPPAKPQIAAKRQAMPGAKDSPAPAPKRSIDAANRGPVSRMQTQLATAIKENPDWKEF
jgi:hypothetical protein